MQILNHAVHLEEVSKQQALSSRPNKQLKVAIVGGSNSVMRDGYTKYLQEYISSETDDSLELDYFAMGGVTSLFGAIQNCRHDIAKNHDVIFFEYCVNDRAAFTRGKYTPRMAGMALEGFIRQAKSANPQCIIIIVIFGTNLPSFYNNCCFISAVYESIARRYEIPVINLTEILLQRRGFKFIKRLYGKSDTVHFERPRGTKIVGEAIAEQVVARQLFQTQPKQLDRSPRMYAGNLQDLKFFSDFSALSKANEIKTEVFKNHFFEEEIHTIRNESSINLKLKGRLLGIMIKSDWYDGLVKIRHGNQEIITSSFSTWIIKEGKSNINLLGLPYQKFSKCNAFRDLSISLCQEDRQGYELDMRKKEPEVDCHQWKLSIIGIAYTGELKTAV